jgi:hypothetical protein
MRSNFTFIIVVVFLALTGGEIVAQPTEDFKMTISGTGVMPLGAEVDDQPIDTGLCAGNSNLYKRVYGRFRIPGSGRFTCTTTGYGSLAPQEEWLENTANCPGGIEAPIVEVERNHIVQFADGDMMWWYVDKEAYHYGCFFPDGTVMQHLVWEIIGGSGRFKGATGMAEWWIPATWVPIGSNPTAMAVAHDGWVEGTITYGP